MDNKQFHGILMLITPLVIKLIVQKYALDEVSASRAFYSSQVYAMLEDEETKIWHFSPQMLMQMYDEEQRTGSFAVPEEG